MAHLLGAENLGIAYPNRTVLDSVSLGIDAGDRIGVVGRNGDGKSTLMRLLARRTTPDAGRVTVRGGVTVGMLDQADTLDETQSAGAAIVGDTPEHEWAGDARVRDVIDGLVADLDWEAPVGALSGGQRRRVALAALLLDEPNVLVLDEPSTPVAGWACPLVLRGSRPRRKPRSRGAGAPTCRGWSRPIGRAPKSPRLGRRPAGTAQSAPCRGRSGSLVAELWR